MFIPFYFVIVFLKKRFDRGHQFHVQIKEINRKCQDKEADRNDHQSQ